MLMLKILKIHLIVKKLQSQQIIQKERNKAKNKRKLRIKRRKKVY